MIFAENKFIFGTYFRNHIETSFNIGVLLQCDFIRQLYYHLM